MDRKKDSKPVHQHWVPQFYLRHFATPETLGSDRPKIYFVDKTLQSIPKRPTAVRNMCGKRYIYSPLSEDGQRDWSFEDWLGKLEDFWAPKWNDLSVGSLPLTKGKSRRDFATFIASMHLRNAFVANTVSRIYDLTTRLFGTELQTRPRSSRIESAQPKSPPKRPPDPTSAFVETNRASIDRVSDLLLNKAWTVLCSENDLFMTSDRPVAFFHPEYGSAGPGIPGSTLIFPITPKRLLVMQDAPKMSSFQHVKAEQDAVDAANNLIWKNASRFVMAGRRLS